MFFEHSLLMNMYTVYVNEASFGREIPVDGGTYKFGVNCQTIICEDVFESI